MVAENLQEIWCVNGESNLCLWDGNSRGNLRWGKRVLHWDGANLDWVSTSSASVRNNQSGWEEVNRSNGKDIVTAITSGRRLMKPDRRKQADFHRLIDNLQATVKEKDDALARATEALNKSLEENHALRIQLQSKPSNTSYPLHQLPSTLASVLLDGSATCLGDRAYIPLCDSLDQPLSGDESVLNISERGGEDWNTDCSPGHSTILHISSTVS